MTILITGTSRGVGAALKTQYEARGESVIGTSTAGGDGQLALDVTDPPAFAVLRDALGNRPLDVLVCNAGIFPARGEDIATGNAPRDWERALATNVTGVFLTIQSCLSNLLAARGKIAILSSRVGSSELAGGGNYIYRASKAAVLNLGRNLAVDLRAEGVAVGIYHPGHVATDMGGAGAPVTPAASAAGLADRIDDLTLANTGRFLAYDGEVLPF